MTVVLLVCSLVGQPQRSSVGTVAGDNTCTYANKHSHAVALLKVFQVFLPHLPEPVSSSISETNYLYCCQIRVSPHKIPLLSVFTIQGHFYYAFIMQMYSRNALR